MNPLLYMIILSNVFQHLTRFSTPNYPTFLLSGIITWNLFSQSLAIGVNSVAANGGLLRKVRVPAAVFPAASVCSCAVNFVLALIPFLLVGWATGLKLTPWALLAPFMLFPYLVFIYGAALCLGSLNVAFRDVGHTLEPLLSMLYFASPILYPISSLPESVQSYAWLNPIAHYVTVMRDLIFYGQAPDAKLVGGIYAFAIVSLGIGSYIYRRCRAGFVYYV